MSGDMDLCECGHEWWEHVPLPGYPGGCDECQVGDCDCGRFRPATENALLDDEES